MKSQDIFILFKLISLEKSNQSGSIELDHSVRNLASLTGVGKTEVSNAINRSIEVGLAKRRARQTEISVNRKSLYEFIYYGLRYVFPVKPLELTRGIPTAFAARVLNQKLFTPGDYVPVWPDAQAKSMGQAVKPLYRTVPNATSEDEQLYAYLALVDAIRLGGAREKDIAGKELYRQMDLP